jgi:hypothetical protein
LGECRAIGPGYTPATLGAALPYRAQCWSNVNAGLVAGFVRWMLQEGYAIGSINVRLATVKVYARLAAQAGAITEEEARLIATNRGYGGKAARNMDASRVTTRKGTKKAEATPISDTQVVALKTREDTPCAERPRSLSPTRASKNFSPWPATKSTRALSICSLSEFGRS